MTTHDELLDAVAAAPRGSIPCRTGDPERFFMEQGGQAQGNRVKAECEPCPVREKCLGYALRNRVEGIWGGTTDEERKDLRRRLKVKAAPVFRSQDFVRHQAVFEAHMSGVSLSTCASRFGITKRSVERTVLAERTRRGLLPPVDGVAS